MKFFQKQSIAWALCICMILGAIVIGQVKAKQNEYAPAKETSAEKWAWEHYTAYDKYVNDEKDLISASTQKQLAIYNASSDFTYDTVCGIWILDTAPTQPLQDLAESYMHDLGLGKNDFLLLLDTENKDWFFTSGVSVSPNYNHDLELLIAEASASVFQSGEKALVKLFSNLNVWYNTCLTPVDNMDHLSQAVKIIGRTAKGILIAVLVVSVIIIGGIVILCVVLARKYTSHKKAKNVGVNSMPHYASTQAPPKQTAYTSDRQKQNFK